MNINLKNLRKIIAGAVILMSTTTVRADPTVRITAERMSKLPWAWHTLKIAVRVQNVTAQPISVKVPFFDMSPEDPWTTIDFLVEKNGKQLRRRYLGQSTSNMDAGSVVIQPGETSEPFIFDLQDGGNWGHKWYVLDGNGKPSEIVGDRLGWGTYTARIKFFNPRRSSKDLKLWRGEVTSEPFAFTVL